jgi:uncharacterized membrane protein YqjE
VAKFGNKDPNGDDVVAKVDMTPPPQVTVVDVNNNSSASSVMAQQTVQMNQQTAQAQAAASVGLAQTAVDKEIVESQLEKQEEHWVKAYWRPAMGWLYMAMCAMDFIVFPIFSMIQPIVMRAFKYDMTYVAWQSLTLSNGGMIHIAFGAILGVAAYTRGQEKLAKIN